MLVSKAILGLRGDHRVRWALTSEASDTICQCDGKVGNNRSSCSSSSPPTVVSTWRSAFLSMWFKVEVPVVVVVVVVILLGEVRDECKDGEMLLLLSMIEIYKSRADPLLSDDDEAAVTDAVLLPSVVGDCTWRCIDVLR